MRRRTGSIAIEIILETIGDTRIASGRGLLALTGIAIGTAAVIAMLHVGHNARREALRQFEALGTDLVLMQPQSSGNTVAEVDIDDVLALPMQKIGISDVSAITQAGGNIRARRSDVQANIIAATDGIYALGKAKLDRGRFTSDFDSSGPFAVLGAGVAANIQAIDGAPIQIGERISLGDQLFAVIGILQDTPSNSLLNIEFDRSVVIPFAAARRLTWPVTISQVSGRLSPGANDEQTAKAVAGYFQPRIANGFMQVATARQVIANIEQQMQIYATLILGIGAVSLVVGGVGIMNVMLMSVMERRQEIGLLLALGARRRDIRLMFLSETLTLSVVGSMIGTAIGYLAGRALASGSDWQFEAAPLALPLGAGMALIVGLFFGIYPAARAASLDPVAALRSEG
ncbi:ABC transporter permease [Rhizobium sp. KAs_5_22]|uniref:ABC transporter permease n=1 Tax=Ciceribacter selenitireducens TaxID=448181 RepID=UPI0004AD09CB|nr:ABC transporter permease [Ciceribacter selenitireducens]PPJ49027.1 ABC transporter permease [Rhizobium sp. KAs_5_22]